MKNSGIKDINGQSVKCGDRVKTVSRYGERSNPVFIVTYVKERTFMADEYGITITGFCLINEKKDDDFYMCLTRQCEIVK